jgi:lipoate-protein ligase B
VEWLGRLAYADAHARMKTQLEARIRGEVGDTLLLLEHEPIYTLGRRRQAADNVLQAGEVPVIEVERGGDMTFHGPGQIVGYPICQLPPHRHDLHGWMRGLETVCSRVLARHGVDGGPDPRNTGVWVEGKKMVAIGVACRRWVSWHGFAMNLDVDLEYFERIHPCGMGSGLVTRLADHVQPCPRMNVIRDELGSEFRRWWREWVAI